MYNSFFPTVYILHHITLNKIQEGRKYIIKVNTARIKFIESIAPAGGSIPKLSLVLLL